MRDLSGRRPSTTRRSQFPAAFREDNLLVAFGTRVRVLVRIGRGCFCCCGMVEMWCWNGGGGGGGGDGSFSTSPREILPEIETATGGFVVSCCIIVARSGGFVVFRGQGGTVQRIGFILRDTSTIMSFGPELIGRGAEVSGLEMAEEDVHAGNRGCDEGVVHFYFGVDCRPDIFRLGIVVLEKL